MPFAEEYTAASTTASSSLSSSSSSRSDSPNAQYFDAYADLSVHRTMLSDAPRMRFYRDVLCDPAVVRDKVVVDVGSGTGVLACWAGKVGAAAHVFSIEASSLAALQPAMFAENGLRTRYVRLRDTPSSSSQRNDIDDDNNNDDNNDDNNNDDSDDDEVRVTVLHGTVESLARDGAAAFIAQHAAVRRAGGVALLVSEWMGFYLLHENMLPSVLCARDLFRDVNAHLAHGNSRDAMALQMLPSTATLYVAPVSLQPYYAAQYEHFWRDVGAGVSMHTMATAAFDAAMAHTAGAPLMDTLPPTCLVHEGVVCWHASLSTLRADECAHIARTAVFCFARSPTARRVWATTPDASLCVDGFTVWFDVHFGEAHVLRTGPEAPATHWKQTTVVLPHNVRAARVVSFARASETEGDGSNGKDDDDVEDTTLSLTLTLTAQQGTAQRCYTLECELN